MIRAGVSIKFISGKKGMGISFLAVILLGEGVFWQEDSALDEICFKPKKNKL